MTDLNKKRDELASKGDKHSSLSFKEGFDAAIQFLSEDVEFDGKRHALTHPCAQECSGYHQGFDDGRYAQFEQMCARVGMAEHIRNEACADLKQATDELTASEARVRELTAALRLAGLSRDIK